MKNTLQKNRGVFLETISLLIKEKLKTAPEDDKSKIESVQNAEKKNALSTVAILPIIMFFCYIGLILYFRSRGGINL